MSRSLTSLAKKKLCVAALEDIKARDILAIDVRRITSMFDWIVIASADSARQTKALARNVRDKLKAADCAIIGTEGEESAEWVLVDSGDVVVHVMQPAVRSYYNLEELWADGKFDRPGKLTTPAAEASRPARAKPGAKPAAKPEASPPQEARRRAPAPRKPARRRSRATD